MSNNTQASGRRLTDVDAFDSMRRERSHSLARTEGFLRDPYTPDLTANEDEHEAQAAAYEQDDQRLQNEEAARDEEDGDYEYGCSSSQSSYDSSWTDYTDAVSSDEEDDNVAQDAEDEEIHAWRGRVQNDEPGLRSHESASSTATDMSHPPYRPKSRKVVGPHDEDEDSNETENEEAEEAPHTPTTSPKKKNAEGATTPNGVPTADTPPAFVQGSSSGPSRGPLHRHQLTSEERFLYARVPEFDPRGSASNAVQRREPAQETPSAAQPAPPPAPPTVLQPVDENRAPTNPNAHDAGAGPSKSKDKGKGKAKEDSTPNEDGKPAPTTRPSRSGDEKADEGATGAQAGPTKGKKRGHSGDDSEKRGENQPPSPRSPGRRQSKVRKTQ